MSFLRRFAPSVAAEMYQVGHDRRLHLLEARRGRGKSYWLTWWIRWCAINRVPVRANFAVDRFRLAVQCYQENGGDYHEWHRWVTENVRYLATWDDVLTAHDEVIVLDEASRLFDSRNRHQVKPVVYEWAQLSRHLRLTLVFASQSFDWLDVRIRQLADTLWLVRKVTDKKDRTLPVEFWAYGFDPFAAGLTSDVSRQAAMDYRMRIPFNVDVATLYDTHQGIRLIQGDPSFASVGQIFDALVADGTIRQKSFVAAALNAEAEAQPTAPLAPSAQPRASSLHSQDGQ